MADDPETTTGAATASRSEPGSGATPAGSTPDGATPTGNGDKGATPDAGLSDAGKAALEREREARREAERNLAQLRDRVNELEDAGKSEVERAQNQVKRATEDAQRAAAKVAELESELSRRDLDALKVSVAAENGLPPSVAKRLQGKDKRELTADAKALAEELQSGTPVGSLGLGRGGAATGRTRGADMNTAIRQAAGR